MSHQKCEVFDCRECDFFAFVLEFFIGAPLRLFFPSDQSSNIGSCPRHLLALPLGSINLVVTLGTKEAGSCSLEKSQLSIKTWIKEGMTK